MSGQLGELVVSLAADTARFRADLGKATKATQDSAKAMSDHFEKIGSAVQATIGIMAGLAGAASLGSLIKGSIDAADNMSKMSQKVGVAIDQLSGMAYAAGLADVSTEQLGKGMGKLAKLMYEAAGDKNGGPAETFKTIGVSVTDAAGKLRNTDDVMMDVADRLAGMKDGAAKTALTMEVFGKAGADLIPLLNGGKKGIQEAADEAKRFGLVLSAEAGKQAEEFNDNLTRLRSRASGAAMTLANELLPEINALVDKFAKGGDLASSPFMQGIHSIKAEFLRVAMLADKAGGSLTAMGMLLYGPGAMAGYKPSEERFKRMADLNIMFEERYKDSEKAMQTMANLEVGLDANGQPFKPAASAGNGNGIGERGKINAAAAVKDGKSLAVEYKKQAQDLFTAVLEIHNAYAAGIQGEGSAFNIMAAQTGDLKTDRYKVTPLSKYRLNTAYGGIPQQAQADAKQAEAIQLAQISNQMALINSADRFNQITTGDAAQQRISLLQQELQIQKDKFDRSAGDELLQLNQLASIQAINEKLLEQKKILSDTTALGGMTSALNSYAASAMNMGAQVSAFTTSVMSGMENAIVNFTMTGKLSFRDMANSIISDLSRIATRQAITGPIAQALGSMFGGNTTIDAEMANNPPQFVGKASGGPVSMGVPYLVGERGPEIFTPGASGQITSNDRLAKLGSGAPVINIINNAKDTEVQTAQPRFDGGQWIVDMVIQKLRSDPGTRAAFAGGGNY